MGDHQQLWNEHILRRSGKPLPPEDTLHGHLIEIAREHYGHSEFSESIMQIVHERLSPKPHTPPKQSRLERLINAIQKLKSRALGRQNRIF